MNTVINWCPFIFILLVLVFVCDWNILIGGSAYDFVRDEVCGDAQFGLTHGGRKSLAADCGKGNLADRNLLDDVCIANLYRPINLPSIIDHTNCIGYHTVFVLVYREGDGTPQKTSFRINAEYDIAGSSDTYVIEIAQGAFDDLQQTGTNIDTSNGMQAVVFVDPHFFTNFKLYINDDQEVNACPNHIDCSSNLCIYFGLMEQALCDPDPGFVGLDFVAYFGIRVKPNGTSDVYKTVAVHAKMKGSYADSSSRKDHFYYIEYKHLQPILEAAKCSTYCTENDTGKTYCDVGDSCGAGTTSTTYSSGSYPPELIGDYAYVPHDSSLNICKLLYETDGDAYASTNIIFDERMGGRPHCDCVYGYGWNVTIQICEACERGLSLIGCPGPCHNKCEWNEYCTVDNNGIEKCVCKEGHTLLSIYGQCKEMLNCHNGTVTMSNRELRCLCNEGYHKSKDGQCMEGPEAISNDVLLNCVADYDNDTTWISPHACATDSHEDTNEKCSFDVSGGINCTYADDYTKLYCGDSCIAILTCRLKETLRLTEHMDFICSCKDGQMEVRENEAVAFLESETGIRAYWGQNVSVVVLFLLMSSLRLLVWN